MKAISTLCFTFAFLQIVLTEVRHGYRTVRQSMETNPEQFQQPVAIPKPLQNDVQFSSSTPAAMDFSDGTISSQTLQPINSIQSENALDKSSPSTALLPPPTSSNSITSSYIPPDLTNPQNIPVQVEPTTSLISHKQGDIKEKPLANAPSPYVSQLPYMNMQPFMYNPYYQPNSYGYMNPQMMYGMQPNPTQYMPFPPFPVFNNQRQFNNSLNIQNTSPYPTTPNYLPAPSTEAQATSPTVMSSTGESGNYQPNSYGYMNPQMMYGMQPNPMQYMPFPPFPVFNNQRQFNNSSNIQNTSPYPTTPNYLPAPSTEAQATSPTVMSSTGESGTDLNSLPPQVKEFIDMIPQILSMHESPSQNLQTPDTRRPSLRKLPKPPARSLFKKKQPYSNYLPYSQYSQNNGYYF